MKIIIATPPRYIYLIKKGDGLLDDWYERKPRGKGVVPYRYRLDEPGMVVVSVRSRVAPQELSGTCDEEVEA